MTIIIGTISPVDHCVSSEGRVLIKDGIEIATEEEDKTFSLYGGKVKGAYSNCMAFDLRPEISNASKIVDHIKELTDPIPPESFLELANKLKEQLEIRLNSAIEPKIEDRALSIILTGSNDIVGNQFVYCRIIFTYKGDKIVGEVTPVNGPIDFLGATFFIPPIAGLGDILKEYFGSNAYNAKTIEDILQHHKNALKLAISYCQDEYKTNPGLQGKICPVGGVLFFQPDL